VILELVLYAAIALAALGLLLYAGGAYNQMVRASREIDRAFANVEVVLRQRHDELPRLVDVCRGYMAHERELLERLVELRSRFERADDVDAKVRAENELGRGLDRMMALAEGYPSLRANELFGRLQDRLTALEETIADRRELFNAAVTAYNVYVESLPARLFAGALGFRPRPLLELGEGFRAHPFEGVAPAR
jgi:LemA protein